LVPQSIKCISATTLAIACGLVPGQLPGLRRLALGHHEQRQLPRRARAAQGAAARQREQRRQQGRGLRLVRLLAVAASRRAELPGAAGPLPAAAPGPVGAVRQPIH